MIIQAEFLRAVRSAFAASPRFSIIRQCSHAGQQQALLQAIGGLRQGQRLRLDLRSHLHTSRRPWPRASSSSW